MAEVDLFLVSTMPRLKEAETALHNGDAGPRYAMWTRRDPVTLFGAAVSGRGWDEVGPVFDWLAARFSNCEFHEYEVIAAGASGDLAYIVGIERTTASVGGAAPVPYALRSRPSSGARTVSGRSSTAMPTRYQTAPQHLNSSAV